MKNLLFTFLLLAVSGVTSAQIKGKKSEEPFTASTGQVFNVGDKIQLKQGSKAGTFAFAYEVKSAFSLKNITNAVNTVSNAKNLGASGLKNVGANVDKLNALSNTALVNDAMGNLMAAAVSEKYATENALTSVYANSSWTIENFKVYTDKATGEQLVHAIVKGSGKTVAILIEFAMKTGEM